MFEPIYKFLQAIGYSHPLHPTLTHVPIGLIFAAFVFALLGIAFKKPMLLSTVRHCVILALVTLPFVAFLGVMDWQHFYAGAWLFPIKAKVVLAALLLVVLVVSLITVFRIDKFSGRSIVIFGVCLLLTFGLGYFGGELVYGTAGPESTDQSRGAEASEGAAIFNRSCSMCHYADKTDKKVGPGLKGLYAKGQMTVSGWEVTDENVRRQIKTPFADMPAFPDMSEEEIQALIDHLQSL